MRIGIDATCWANRRGYGRFTREIVSAMVARAPQHEFVCMLDARAAESFALRGPHIRPLIVGLRRSPTVAAASGDHRGPVDLVRLYQAVRGATLDAFFSPTVYSYFPLPRGLPTVVTIHDAIAERFPALTLPTWRDRLFWTMKVRLALYQARVVLTVSDYAARDLTARLGVPPSRLRVTLEGVSPVFAAEPPPAAIRAFADRIAVGPATRWIVYVGGFGPHKHVEVLVRAHAAVARRLTPPVALVLVGSEVDGFHEDVAGIRAAIQSSGTTALVRWTGYLSDDDLRLAYAGAAALVLPSACEGFGLPAVEAGRCGTPIVATTESPLPEIMAGGGLFVAPGDADALARALEHLLTDDDARRAMGAQAAERAGRLSWSASADVALAAIEDAVARRGV